MKVKGRTVEPMINPRTHIIGSTYERGCVPMGEPMCEPIHVPTRVSSRVPIGVPIGVPMRVLLVNQCVYYR